MTSQLHHNGAPAASLTDAIPVANFTFVPGTDIRAILVDGEPWFVAKDVCDALGYAEVSATLAKHVLDRYRRSIDLNTTTIRRTNRGNPHALCVNELGLYALVMRSRKTEAEAFQHWVYGTVLPDIRKYGAHVVGAEALPVAQREAFYGLVRNQLTEALRRIDRDTEHDHFCSAGKRQKRLQGAVTKVAQDMGLPMHVVAALVDGGVDKGLMVMVTT